MSRSLLARSVRKDVRFFFAVDLSFAGDQRLRVRGGL
jgi:hypothetical protein